jgi:hypothetical protein
MLEVVDPGLDDFVRPSGAPDTERLMDLPTLVMPEIGDSRSVQVAQVGNIVSLTKSGRDYRFRFIRNNTIPNIPSHRIQAAAGELRIGDWGFNRTRWSVKAGDLYQVLFEQNLVGIPTPTAFELPLGQPEPNRIAVMMPFSSDFTSVWETLKDAAAEGGWVCQRADDIWENSVLIHDVVALIARSKVVVCDLTGRNANVFYETGIAHTLGREVVSIAQSEHDIPFDLTHHRYVKYLRNAEGLSSLKAALSGRPPSCLGDLAGRLTIFQSGARTSVERRRASGSEGRPARPQTAES